VKTVSNRTAVMMLITAMMMLISSCEDCDNGDCALITS